MAKMKYFGKAMAVVRKAPRKNGKLADRTLGTKISQMLAAVRAKNYAKADEIAKVIAGSK